MLAPARESPCQQSCSSSSALADLAVASRTRQSHAWRRCFACCNSRETQLFTFEIFFCRRGALQLTVRTMVSMRARGGRSSEVRGTL